MKSPPPPSRPLHPFKAFPSYLLQTWCTWCVSLPPPPTHSAPPTLYISPPMRALRLSQPLLQQAPDWLLFLGIFGRRRGLEYLVLPLFTHTQGAGSNWVNEGESGGARQCGFSALHPLHPTAFPQLCFHSLVLPWTSEQFFISICSARTDQSFHSSTNQWTVCSLLDFAQASSKGAQSVPAVCGTGSAGKTTRKLIQFYFLLPCLTLRWNARSELFHLRVVDVHSGKREARDGGVGGRGWECSRLTCCCSISEEVNNWWLRCDSGLSLRHLQLDFQFVNMIMHACVQVQATTSKISHAFFSVQSSACALCDVRHTQAHVNASKEDSSVVGVAVLGIFIGG